MAVEFYVMVKASKQGTFMGESAKPAHKDQIAASDFEYSVVSPRDLASGNASGKRQHNPIKIIKEWGASTPQFFQALITNEVLKLVTFEFVQNNAEGKEEVFYTVKLTNAAVSKVAQFTSPQEGAGRGSPGPSRFLEAIEFTFQKIELGHMIAKTSASDDWHK